MLRAPANCFSFSWLSFSSYYASLTPQTATCSRPKYWSELMPLKPLNRSAAEPTGFSSFLRLTHCPDGYSLLVSLKAGVSIFYASLTPQTATFSSTSVLLYLLVYASPRPRARTASTGFFAAIGSIDVAPSALPPSPLRVMPFYVSLSVSVVTFFWEESEWEKDFASTGTGFGVRSTTSVPFGSMGSAGFFGAVDAAGAAGIAGAAGTAGATGSS